jgi:AcrR family transcriptional regulator
MKFATRPKRGQAELKKKILDAARELFVAEGAEAVSMRKVADKIGYTATTLYNHFEDKESLLRALCEADFQKLQAKFLRIGQIADPIERLRKLGQTYIEFALRHPSHYRLMFMTPHVPRDSRSCPEIEPGNPDQDAYAFLRETVALGLAARVFRCEHSDPDLLAQVVWSSVHGVASLHLIMGKDTWCHWHPVKEVGRELIDVMIRGLAR